MFASIKLDEEVARVKGFLNELPQGFHLNIRDVNLCRYYLYHHISGNAGVYNESPILHLHHADIPLMLHRLMDQFNETNVETIFYMNQSLLVITDGEFELSADEWVGGRRRVGPIFVDHMLQFHSKRYKFRAAHNDPMVLDVFTASAIPNVIVPATWNFNYRVIKVDNPKHFKILGRRRRPNPHNGTGPYGPLPSPFLGPPER